MALPHTAEHQESGMIFSFDVDSPDERANTAINRKLLAYLAGDWCPGHAARFARLAANRAAPTEAKEALEHLDACPSCRTAYETFTRLHPNGA